MHGSHLFIYFFRFFFRSLLSVPSLHRILAHYYVAVCIVLFFFTSLSLPWFSLFFHSLCCFVAFFNKFKRTIKAMRLQLTILLRMLWVWCYNFSSLSFSFFVIIVLSITIFFFCQSINLCALCTKFYFIPTFHLTLYFYFYFFARANISFPFWNNIFLFYNTFIYLYI